MMAGMVGEGVEQRQQQRDRQDDDQEFRRFDAVVLENVADAELVFLEIVEFGKQIEGHPENQKTAEAVAERDEQFAQQVAVQQAHSLAG